MEPTPEELAAAFLLRYENGGADWKSFQGFVRSLGVPVTAYQEWRRSVAGFADKIDSLKEGFKKRHQEERITGPLKKFLDAYERTLMFVESSEEAAVTVEEVENEMAENQSFRVAMERIERKRDRKLEDQAFKLATAAEPDRGAVQFLLQSRSPRFSKKKGANEEGANLMTALSEKSAKLWREKYGEREIN